MSTVTAEIRLLGPPALSMAGRPARLHSSKTLALLAYLLLEGAQRAPDNPTSAMIEISDHCNEVCVHCYQVQGQKGEMSTGEILKILDDLAEMGVRLLRLQMEAAAVDQLAHASERGVLPMQRNRCRPHGELFGEGLRPDREGEEG